MSSVEATIRHSASSKVELAERLEALGFEIDQAMAAIAGDRLQAFEQSVRRQEVACNRLSALAAELAPLASNATALRSDEDGALNLRLRSATSAIRTLNAQYSALLRHSGQSLRLLASLFGNTTGYAGHTLPKQQTWSCEV